MATTTLGSPLCSAAVWDKKEAAFAACFLPVVSSTPAVAAAALFLYHIAALLVARRGRSPDRGWNAYTAALSLVTSIVLVLQFPEAVQRWPAVDGLMPAVVWFALLGLIISHRSQKAPLSALALLILQAITTLILMLDRKNNPNGIEHYGYGIATLIFSLIAICIIINMPLRDPQLSAKDVSKPMSEPTSTLRSPEDNLTPWQFMSVSWMSPLIRIGYKRQLEDEDVWQLPYEFQHQGLHDNFRLLKGTVVRRLVKANIIDLCILTCLGLLELVMQFSTPLLLQLLLSSMEDLTAPKKAAVTYAALSLAVRLISAQSGVFSLWYGRRCYERSRGEMITMLYEKTLGRKISFLLDRKLEEDLASEEEHLNGYTANGNATSKPKPSTWRKAWFKVWHFFRTRRSTSLAKDPANMGKILNLMRNDVYEIAQRFWEFQALVQKPLGVIFSITLVVRLLGWPSLIAVLAMLLAQALNVILARVMIHFEKKRRRATDSKLQVISQFVEAIRHLRWYGWQGTWLTQILTARQRELNLRIVTAIWNLAIALTNTLALDLTPVIAFFAYTVIAGKPLRIDIAFPAMQLFQMMTNSLRELPNLIVVMINAWVAVGRIEDFMAEPDKQVLGTEALTEGILGTMSLDRASFAWPGSTKPVLTYLNLSFPEGLTVVCGEVASGKSALLQALLGELDLLAGKLIRPNGAIGYCAQTPWLQSMSIRENILFSTPWDEKRYKQVLDACALTPDFAEFKAGDLSLVGENGIGLSGGQRARVALARAVYSRAQILLLDDPLSALDQQTAELIVERCFAGDLLKGRTVVLVTHRTSLVVDLAAQMIEMQNGRADLVGHELKARGSWRTSLSAQRIIDHEIRQRERQPVAVPDKFIEDEHRAYGGVKASVYWEYVKAGGLLWWAILVPVLAIYRMVAIGEAWFLKTWAEAYKDTSSSVFLLQAPDMIRPESALFNEFPRPDVNIKPWLIGFLIIALGQSSVFIVSQIVMIVIIYKAGKNMFIAIMERVAGATFRFYDITPVGRLMNRMTSDIGVIDGNISMRFQSVAWGMISWISAIIVIGSVTPTFLVFSVLLTISFAMIFRRFIPTSQNLRRLEMVSLTPLMSNFGALLNGLATVRAFGVQHEFQDRVIRVVDTFQKMDHFYWSLQAWLMYRYDLLSAFSTFLITVLALATHLSAGLTAFVLIAANKLVQSTHNLCRQYGQLQMEFVSVERVVELLHLDQEPKGEISPPAWWPSFSGDIRFDSVTIKYAPHLDPALVGVSFTVKGGSKTALIGRTGSGKSTLALAILATVLPEYGHILVDNIDLAKVDKQLLRTRVTFLAQDPVLFPGTMRKNLDPVNEHSDKDCELILRRVCERQGWELDTKIEAGGLNLSQGQRQLVGLARAVLRRSAIIILDEATASIDYDTATQIQEVMHEEMKDSTVITIAHRLEAVRNADYCIVLGKGEIIKQGPAAEMLQDIDRVE